MIDMSARALATDPQWIPHTYDVNGRQLTAVHVTREERETLVFLGEDDYRGRFPRATHDLADVAAHVGSAPAAPLHYIFHTAFCCSTLLAKALEVPGTSLVLKEPDILINLANRFIRSEDLANRQRLALVLRLLARPFEPGETVIVKPTNFANRLIFPVLAANPASRAILLYSDLPTLLRSLAKKGLNGRSWGRKLYAQCARWSSLDFGYTAEETFTQTDLQIIGLAWLMQVHHFSEAARAFPGRVRVIESADFMANVERALADASSFFGLGFDAETIASIAVGPAFSTHSKFAQRDYSIAAREQDHEAMMAAHGEEIEMVVKWVEAVAAHCGVSMRPGESAMQAHG